MAKDDLELYNGFLSEELTPAQNRGFYICPLCGSGTGPHKTAALGIYKNSKGFTRWGCRKCGEGGSIFDLYEKRDGLTTAEAIKAVQAKYSTGGGLAPRPAPVRAKPEEPTPESIEAAKAYIRACAERMPGSAGEKYLMQRGLTPETIRRFRLGFNPTHALGGNKADQHPAVIIPHGGEDCPYYCTRQLDAGQPHPNRPNETVRKFDFALRSQVGPKPLFNASALYRNSKPVFVVESQLCAISIEQAGGNAVALGGTSGVRPFIQQISDRAPTASTFILCSDVDGPGQTAAAKLVEQLDAKGFKYAAPRHLCGYDSKDPNEILQKVGAERFALLVQQEIDEAIKPIETDADRAAEEYAADSAAGYITAFMGQISEAAKTIAIPTGYKPLDEALDGGLYEGMYVIGAISSLGKTTFALQMIDQIARAGHDAIVFSLEMARFELMARSISRLTYQISQQNNIDKRNAKTTRGILDGSKWSLYNSTERQLMQQAIEEYQQNIAPRVWIHEGIGNIGITQIREAVARHIAITGNHPVVLIDYLQILAPHNERMTDKQNTDKAVLELKRMSRDLKTPVVIVSSLNRASYTDPINTAALKESGAIEYTADVILGLQYTGMDYVDGETDKARESRIRGLLKDVNSASATGSPIEIDVKLLKNRNGKRAPIDPLHYVPMFNAFSTESIERTTGYIESSSSEIRTNARKRR